MFAAPLSNVYVLNAVAAAAHAEYLANGTVSPEIHCIIDHNLSAKIGTLANQTVVAFADADEAGVFIRGMASSVSSKID